MAQEMFAYGDTKVQGQACVVASVDKDLLEGEVLTVAEEYDDIACERFGRVEGITHASNAEELWQKAIDKVKDRLQVESDPDHAKYLRRAISQAEDVKGNAF